MRVRLTFAAAVLLSALSPGAAAETCTPAQFRKVIDDTGAALRRINAEGRQRFEAGIKRLREARGWSEEETAERSAALLSDSETESYDRTATELLARLDRLSEEGAVRPDCARLAELETTALELQATVRVKLQHSLARLEALSAVPQPPPQPSAKGSPPSPSPSPAPREAAPAAPGARPPTAAGPRDGTPPSEAKTAGQRAPVSGWSTTTAGEGASASAERRPAAGVAPPRATMPEMPTGGDADGYTIEEIREVSRGFFGTISTGLASVIEHAFRRLGRPAGYVLGDEAGGAFFAGLRYGRGTLYLRAGGSRDVYWHGPSIGYDFGASGSKVLFLVYNLRDPIDVFAGFTGVDGSAYLVGGVGLTVLTDGRVVMAPIRSGVGLRLGASIGYIRFTARPTWNPF